MKFKLQYQKLKRKWKSSAWLIKEWALVTLTVIRLCIQGERHDSIIHPFIHLSSVSFLAVILLCQACHIKRSKALFKEFFCRCVAYNTELQSSLNLLYAISMKARCFTVEVIPQSPYSPGSSFYCFIIVLAFFFCKHNVHLEFRCS